MARVPYEDEIIISWVELHRDARFLSQELHKKGPWKGIIAVTRGGLVPAALVFAGFVWGLVALGIGLPGLVDWATPYADDWQAFWRVAFRALVAVVVFAGAAVLAFVTFTALTLIVGDPFYERIWSAVEAHAAGAAPGAGPGFWGGVRGGLGEAHLDHHLGGLQRRHEESVEELGGRYDAPVDARSG
jgi:hypothetical protein